MGSSSSKQYSEVNDPLLDTSKSLPEKTYLSDVQAKISMYTASRRESYPLLYMYIREKHVEINICDYSSDFILKKFIRMHMEKSPQELVDIFDLYYKKYERRFKKCVYVNIADMGIEYNKENFEKCVRILLKQCSPLMKKECIQT